MAAAAERPLRSYGRTSTHHDLSIIYEGRTEEIPTRVPDVGPRGMFINTSRSFPEGAVLKVQFRLTRSGYLVNARAEVRYCLPDVGIGVEFVEISEEAQRAIEYELDAARRP
ncbi:MAG TPA: PilZ domain-containing protein [Terriglobales bacterium]|nr:PilZ domain-containing protein [Terriglobales bacterium]